MLFVCYPKCSTCQRARALLDRVGAEYEVRDIKADNPSADEIKKWRETSGLPLKRFFNTSGNSYKNLGLKERLPEMSEAEQLSMLSNDGMLVKRPILVGDGFVLVGFREGEWEEYLKNREPGGMH
ncbi:MAG: arsenate reductase family protein [Synergistaceae bacterium]|jgi:arsenate reductase|nr:arsenate reductase family protein [Synergistaceae bacterium]